MKSIDLTIGTPRTDPPPIPSSVLVSPKEEREEKRLQKEYLRRLKKKEKLDTLERDKLEVECFENELRVLLTVHKDCSKPLDLKPMAISFPPHHPAFSSPNHLRASLGFYFSPPDEESNPAIVEEAWTKDTTIYQEVCSKYQSEYIKWSRRKTLSQRILSGDATAYREAITEFCWFEDIGSWGDSFSLVAHDSKRIECRIPVNGKEIIPNEIKSLTSFGKLSAKQMPKGRFHEIYQAYVCGCCLRVGRELFSLLPVDEVIVTSTVLLLSNSTGRDIQQPVLSVHLKRKSIESLNFERLDPVEALSSFDHRGSIKGSQKKDEFDPIAPLCFEDTRELVRGSSTLQDYLEAVTNLRKTLLIPTQTGKRDREINSQSESEG